MSDSHFSKAGKARAKKMTPEARKQSASKAAAARWGIPKATHGGPETPLTIGGVKISCYVLEDGTRVLAQRGLQSGIGLSEGGSKTGARKIVDFLHGLEKKGINIRDLSARANSPIKFIPTSGRTVADGYDAKILPDLCAVIIDAMTQGKLTTRQIPLAERCAMLQHGFATVGIVALVDEATGYQRDRAADALSRILESFVAKELRPWVKTFPTDFYENLCRLRNVDFPLKSGTYPSYFGHLTNDAIYSRLAPSVLEEMKARAKQDALDGKPKGRLHQRLTPEIGHPKLRELLTSVTTIMKLSDRWEDFKSKLDRVHPAFNQTLQLPFSESKLAVESLRSESPPTAVKPKKSR